MLIHRRFNTLALLAWLLGVLPSLAADRQFEVTFAPQVRQQPYSGRLYLFFTRHKNREPRLGPDWFQPEPVVAVDIENWKPGEPLTIGPALKEWMVAFPRPLAELKLTGFRVQALARFNPYDRKLGNGEGNGFSSAVELPEDDSAVRLMIDRLVESPPFPENQWCQLLAVKSVRLSAFHRRNVALQGAVLLPASYYAEPARRYPVIYTVPGFGGTHRDRIPREPIKEQNAEGVEFIRVVLDPSCPLGHHVFADSENNGPVGRALVDEFVPELDLRFRTIAKSSARFLTGHSSGGWSTLWLQVAYPETFGGTWSTSPDPVDFRDFQRIDLYRAGVSMYRDDEGQRRPIARVGGQVQLWYDDFDKMEEVLGFGGQLHSFEAVFSPRGADGKPLRVWDRKTGVVDTAAAEHWKKYDIRLILESRWDELGPQLGGKLHVIMGEEDTFYLEGATRLLGEALRKLDSDAVVELVPGKDHSNIFSPELVRRIREEMVAAFLRHHSAP
ncbi:MAG: alpha/beta hydrolase-fold protein [Planctomycetales bacterium]